MPDTMHVEPVVRQHFAARHRLPDPVDQNLAATTGQTSQPGLFQAFQHRLQRQFVHLGEVMDFRRTEAVDVDLREPGLDSTQHLLVPVELVLRMQATLQQNLVAA